MFYVKIEVGFQLLTFQTESAKVLLVLLFVVEIQNTFAKEGRDHTSTLFGQWDTGPRGEW